MENQSMPVEPKSANQDELIELVMALSNHVAAMSLDHALIMGRLRSLDARVELLEAMVGGRED